MSKKLKLARAAGPIVLAACVAFGFASAASADGGNDWNHHGWDHNNGWHGNDSSSFGIYLGGPGYYSPPAYYAPPPVYYAPAPVYYPPQYYAPQYYAPQPSLGLQFNVR